MKRIVILLPSVLFLVLSLRSEPLRRPISPTAPTWIIHIDVWIDADPKKIIEMVPLDIRPHVVFNLSLSVSDPGGGPYGSNVNMVSIFESWIRTCAELGVWTTIQPASGYKCNLPYTHSVDDVYEYFYKTYPNFIGYNFCEQCWGFSNETAIQERLTLLSDLLALADQYGGYLMVSHAQTMSTPQLNAVGFLKKSSVFRNAAKTYRNNYISFEKYTTSRGFYDVESTTLGCYLSGYCGNYGIRFDNCGWSYIDSRGKLKFPDVTGIIPIVEHSLFTGQTLSDGPELTWQLAVLADGTQTIDGYSSKCFKLAPNFTNNNLDIFRKLLDGSIRIPDRNEVIAQTKVAYVNDATSGDNRNQYSSEKTLFTGLYAMDVDDQSGEWDQNNNWLKKSGRYPTIPTLFQTGADETGGFSKVVTNSNYPTTWPSIQSKIDDLNQLFPQEYVGTIYARRINNNWMTYNPYLSDSIVGQGTVIRNYPTSGSIPLKYNTCERMEIEHPNYSMALVREYTDRLEFYLNNYCQAMPSALLPLLRTDVIKIVGSSIKPTFTHTPRGGAESGPITISETWADGVFSLAVKHNGPLDLTIHCQGNGSPRLTAYPPTPTISSPAPPPLYAGARQYEAENFEYKNILGLVRKSDSMTDYTALGYLNFGTSSSASIRKVVSVPMAGRYKVNIRYQTMPNTVNGIDIYVNSILQKTPAFVTTGTSWGTNEQELTFKAGANTIEFRARSSRSSFLFDHIIIVCDQTTTAGLSLPENTCIVFEETYNLMGQSVLKSSSTEFGGFVVVRSTLSDGTIRARKEYRFPK